MNKLLKTSLWAFAVIVALAAAGCNMPRSSDDDDDDNTGGEPYAYVNGNATHSSGQEWTITLDYQCDSDPLEVGIIVMRDDTEVRRVNAKKAGSAFPAEGTASVDFSWRAGEQGCTVKPFVSTAALGVKPGWDIQMPFGVAINSLTMELSGEFDFKLLMNYFCDCNLTGSRLVIYNQNDNVVLDEQIYVNGYSTNQDFDAYLYADNHGLAPKTNYRAVLTLTTEYNSASAECRFTTPSRHPNIGDNNPPEV